MGKSFLGKDNNKERFNALTRQSEGPRMENVASFERGGGRGGRGGGRGGDRGRGGGRGRGGADKAQRGGDMYGRGGNRGA